LNAACRAAPAAAPAPGCRGDDVGLMGSWPVGGWQWLPGRERGTGERRV
jgi:hypothetical protein